MTSADTFKKVVDWLHDEIIQAKQAPGLLVGLSGTDSIVAFLAAYKALERVNKADRLLGVHFAPSKEFLEDYPEAESHRWFSIEIIPWLRKQAPHANIEVDTSIDWRYDGLRWGALADESVMDRSNRRMRSSENKYWIVGTRNRTEHLLYNYSVASKVASVQPIVDLWKSDILDICEYLKVPALVINKSCEADCICGREELRARFGKELDIVLSTHVNTLQIVDPRYTNMNPVLRQQLEEYIKDRMKKGAFKEQIPYVP